MCRIEFTLKKERKKEKKTAVLRKASLQGRPLAGIWETGFWVVPTIPRTDKNGSLWDFPGSPVVKTSPSNAGGVGSIPGQGAKIPHALWPKNQNIKQKQYCNKFNKDFKNGPHQNKQKKI